MSITPRCIKLRIIFLFSLHFAQISRRRHLGWSSVTNTTSPAHKVKEKRILQQPRENRLAYGRDGVECSTSRDSGDSSTYFDPMVQCHSLRSQGTPPPRSLPSPETAPRPPRSAVTRCVLYCVWDRVGWRHVFFVFSLVTQLMQQQNKGEPRCRSVVA